VIGLSIAVPGALLLLWLLLSVPDGLSGWDLLAGVPVALLGVLAASRWPGLGRWVRRRLAPDDEPPPGDPDALDPAVLPTALDSLLRTLAVELHAHRLAVWQVDTDRGRLEPVHVFGRPLKPTSAAGSPLTWAATERGVIRLDPAPHWALGTVVAVSIDPKRVLTAEWPLDHTQLPPRALILRTAALLGPFLRLHDQQRDAVAASERLDRIIELLRRVPRYDATQMPEALARTAIEVVGAEGAAVAAWDGSEGRILARDGEGGGPQPGTMFQASDGDLAHAARTGAVLRRAPGEASPLATADERWDRGVAYRVTIPLVDPRDTPRGAIAAWGVGPLAEQGITLLEALAPLLALQLAQGADLARFRQRATIDALTALPNRAALDDRLEEIRALFDRYRRPVAALVIDLDHFKRINDTWGHDAGDAVLRHVARVLRTVIRDTDFAARFGGEELVVLLPETLLRPAIDVGERIRAAIADTPAEVDGQTISLTASVGVSACPECVDDPGGLFTSADQALYTAKEGGRNRVEPAAVRTPAESRAEP
jgi:diguanylate cyclase (GGDEF)-like protein